LRAIVGPVYASRKSAAVFDIMQRAVRGHSSTPGAGWSCGSIATSSKRTPCGRCAEVTAGARANEAEASRQAARGSLPEFIRLAMPDIEPARHHRYVIERLEEVARHDAFREPSYWKIVHRASSGL
jgi:hypothetical protein